MDLAGNLSDNLADVGRDILGPVRDLGSYIRSQRTSAQISLRALAEKAGVSNPYLSQVERGLRRPSAAILTQIADGLSISAETLLTKAGILRPSEQATPVVDAIRGDQDLSERQKASLIDIYTALRHESLARRGTREPGHDETSEGTSAASHPVTDHPTRAVSDHRR
jgi:transcriptional regulator with XRE-family HTH domain